MAFRQQEALRDSVIGEYQSDGKDGYSYTYFFLENGVCFESRISHGVTAIGDGTVGLAIEGGSSRMENNKWSIENKEIHVKHPDGDKEVWRINTDRSITQITKIKADGRRLKVSKQDQDAYKKIK